MGDSEIVLNGSLQELERLTEQVSRFVQEGSWGDDVEFDLNLVLEELFVNALLHGGCEGMENAVSIRLHAANGDVTVDYRDRGTPFDPTSAPAPNLEVPLEERRAGGLGIHFVRQIMSGLQYERCGNENRLKMTRVTK